MCFPLVLLAVAAMQFTCVSPAFHDGDNIRCGGRTMRLAAIDAPELAGSPKCRDRPKSAWCDAALAIASRDHLRSLGQSGTITCIEVAKPDRYGRPIVRCRVGAVDLSDAQLAAGLARRWP